MVDQEAVMHHIINGECPCGTKDISILQEDGSIDWVIIHNNFPNEEMTSKIHAQNVATDAS